MKLNFSIILCFLFFSCATSKKKTEYDIQTKLDNYLGSYSIKALLHKGEDLKQKNIFGELFIAKNHVSIDIKDIDLNFEKLVHFKDIKNVEFIEGNFIFDIGKNEEKIVLLMLNQEQGLGVFGIDNNDNSDKTVFRFTITSEPDKTYKKYYGTGELKIVEYYSNNQLIKKKEFFKSGSLRGTTQFKNGMASGEVKIYFESGKLKMSQVYEKGNSLGVYKRFHKSGQLKKIGERIDEYEDGEWLSYYENGNLESISNFKKGILNDSMKLFHPNGKIKTKGFYNKGKKFGIWQSFGDDGILKTKRIFNNQGEIIENHGYNKQGKLLIIFSKVKGDKSLGQLFYENGKVKAKGNLTNTSKTGEWKEYHENGQVKASGSYINDMRNGEWKEYHSNGQLMFVGKYVVGEPDGKWKEYDKNGKYYQTKFWENGKLISTSK